MRVAITIFLLTFFFPIMTSASEETYIIEVSEDPTEVKQQIEKYHPLLEVEYVYDTIMQAVAVSGDERHIEKLHQESFTQSIHQTQIYSTPAQQKNNQHDHELPISHRPPNVETTGEGVKIGVIDTGIDHTHPALSDNYKGGFDLVDHDDDPMETTPEQGAPTMHGTHVAGIIAANDDDIQGVAPGAEIYAYRALGPGGSGSSAQVMAAIERSVKDGMDILNLSLGTSINSPDEPMTLAVNKAVELGVTVVVANGNSGPDSWTVGSPATADRAISVGAAQSEAEIPVLQIEDKEIPIRSLPLTKPWTLSKKYPVTTVSDPRNLGQTIQDRIVLIEKDERPYIELVSQAISKGATAIIFTSNEGDDPNQWEWVDVSVPVAYVTKEEADQITQSDEWLATTYETINEQMAPFSSRGPVASNWDIKPDIIAPGVDILSTVPGGYASLQGTSMAAPYITGVVALLKEQYPDESPEQLKNRLQSSSDMLQKINPSEQGSGHVDAESALEAKYTIEDSVIQWDIIEDSTEHQHEITIKNHSGETLPIKWNIPKRLKGLQWDLPLSTHIPPQTEETFPLKIRAHRTMLPPGVQEGFITLEIDHEKRNLPYLFVHQTADYPRVTGLTFEENPFHQQKELSIYLAEAADSLEVTLFSQDLSDQTTILQTEDLEAGVFNKTFESQELPSGKFQVIVTTRQGEETFTETFEIYL
ncbi:peptidase S8 [Halalkalibacillus sediminis]|uniref:Peptidase S8 n=1 Tax=Halalkalibacillus sediminis TaxID=2018042 RepID=A0A2I0QTU8_9BACI|nr:S8 family serine peptidase [Halalkalibacillus sediminis]PKR77746.1 peptidase S8 [Halalkalibacillus sediminis]